MDKQPNTSCDPFAACGAQPPGWIEATRLLAQARAATQAREEILAVVSHDLRSPLGTIANALQSMSRELLDLAPEDGSRLRKYVDTIGRSTTRMTRLTNDLLDLASIDSGRLSIRCERQPISELIWDSLESFEAQAAKRRIRLGATVPDGIPDARCDKDRLLQVLANLVSNALRFTMPGGSVHIEARRAEQTILMAVRDTGHGMAPDVLAHLFDREWQATRRNSTGYGLGISISKAIIEAHGGAMFAESKLGEGTRISFTLPIATCERPSLPVVSSESQRPCRPR